MTPQAATQAGFTLVEMLVVVTVLGLALGIATGARKVRSTALELQGAAREVAQSARVARARAIATNGLVRLTVDPLARTVRVDGQAPNVLPGSSSVAAAGNRIVIDFKGDGSSSGGLIDLADGKRHARIGVDWLTGRVSLGLGG